LHPSKIVPQFLPWAVQLVVGVQAPQTPARPPPPQVCGEAQEPHDETVREAPQLSVPVSEPQLLPRREQKAALLSGVQVEPPPQTPAMPPPPQV
jgi:hypothetical protein